MECYNDEELLYLTRGGCPIARDTLYLQYYRLITIMVTRMALSCGFVIDEDDYIQIGILSLYKAFDNYRSDRNTTLKTFCTMVVRNALTTKYRKQYLEEKRIYKHSISLDQQCYGEDSYYYSDVIADSSVEYQPRETYVLKEVVDNYNKIVKERSSLFEAKVLELKGYGYNENEIARLLNTDIRSIYNATYRIQKKLNRNK